MSDDFSTPDWLSQAKVFWDTEGRAHALPTWPPTKRPEERPPPARSGYVLEGGVILPTRALTPTLPQTLVLYYVDDPSHGERWVPMSEAVVKAFEELAAQQGVTFEWKSMPPTVSADKVMRRE